MIKPYNPIILALDTSTADHAITIAELVRDYIGAVKIGKELFISIGPSIVSDFKRRGFTVFVDLKLHDIPNTTAKATIAAIKAGADMLTVHCLGGRAMLEAALKASRGSSTLVLGVTVLTSLTDSDLKEIGIIGTVSEQVLRLIELGVEVGLKGFVCSPHEISLIRSNFGNKLTLVVPGIRPLSTITDDDQKRILSAKEALLLGADWLVIGRPIINAPDPLQAAKTIFEEISS